jgi:soluble lytic murein transglycosylase-like protein
MQNRHQKTPARTLGHAITGTKFFLTVALFVPALFAFQSLSEQSRTSTAARVVKVVEVSPKPRSKELVKIYSIVKSHRRDITDAETWRVSEVILEESSKRKIDPLLVLALIQVESGFQSTTVSPMGARGLMQIMPDTGRSLTHTVGHEYGLRLAAFKPESLDDPLLNIRLGVYYLHDLKKQFQGTSLALSAYNFGPAEIQNRLENNIEFPSEFAALVLDAYQRYKDTKHPAF